MDQRQASVSLSKWGLVQGWLVSNLGRRVEVRASMNGLGVTVFDPDKGSETVEARAAEDPSAAAWRAIVALDRARR